MINLKNIAVLGKDCCGCNACEQICPKKCITFEYDKEGFLYPAINEKDCINCGACVKHCPILSDVDTAENPDVYAVKYKDRETTHKSTSGGIFIALARHIIDKDGVVFGCAYDENLVARHICVDKKSELCSLQSSKYVQSDLSGVYTQVSNALKSDKYVLFSGTGCQVAGLKAFLGKEYEKLLTTDIICHGVPSPKLFANYIDHLGKKMGGKLCEYNFRSKEKRGWDLYFKASNSKKSKSDYGFFDPYYNAFLTCKTYRESCYKCKFANSQRVGDITLGDYWGIQKFHPDFYDENGVSLILINTEKGKKYFTDINSEIIYIPSTLKKASVMNKNLSAPSARPACRDNIYEGYDEDFSTYVKTKLAFKVSPKVRIKKMIPLSVKNALKKIKG